VPWHTAQVDRAERPTGEPRQSQIVRRGTPVNALDLAIVQAIGDEQRDPMPLLDRMHAPMLPGGPDIPGAGFEPALNRV
jgi:hypothetical protein